MIVFSKFGAFLRDDTTNSRGGVNLSFGLEAKAHGALSHANADYGARCSHGAAACCQCNIRLASANGFLVLTAADCILPKRLSDIPFVRDCGHWCARRTCDSQAPTDHAHPR